MMRRYMRGGMRYGPMMRGPMTRTFRRGGLMGGPRRMIFFPIGIVICLGLVIVGSGILRFLFPLAIGAVLLAAGVIILMRVNPVGEGKAKRDDDPDAYDTYDTDEKPKRGDGDWV